ncbi:MAG: TIGR03960 family B12-binding radical SAM protein [Thermodesulfobacteriota bacterium]
MDGTSPDDILGRVTRPSRYLGCEVNAVLKRPADVRLHMALAFPDLYDIGTSHFGMQILYHVLNREPDMYAERVFAPPDDMAGILAAENRPLFSLETRTPLSAFDIIGFSLLYELNYTNILLMLDLAGIPFYSASRDDTHPLVIAGGPCTVNPEPVADFFDAMVVGDGETVILEMAHAAIQWKDGGGRDRQALLQKWAGIQGVYIPSFFAVSRDEKDRQVLTPRRTGHERITRAIVEDLEAAVFPDAPVLPFGKPVHDRLRIEIARGCTRGCRFCQAGMIYRPVRERSFSRLADIAHKSLRSTGYEDLSLLSLSTGDYSCLSPLMTHLMRRYAEKRIAVSIPSFRAGSVSGELMEEIRKVRKTGFTIAPEAGSERLRAVINKNITEEEIIQTAVDAFGLGWNIVKLYFMIGLPTETDDDLDAIVRLVKRLKGIRPPGKGHFKINASVAAFIPKSHTPFQWSPQADLETARNRIDRLRRDLKMPGVGFKWQNPQTSRMEGLFARGDRRLASLLLAAYQRGCRFDGWSDSFQYAAWQEALDQSGIDPEKMALQTADTGAPLPWDHIDTRISRDFLQAEYERAFSGGSTPDCRNGECQDCGVCDFDTIMPRTADDPVPVISEEAPVSCETETEPALQWLRLAFTRTGRARFLSHLEQVNVFLRAVNRAGLPVAFSSGFHPKAKITFADALPVGVESLGETVHIAVNRPVEIDRAIADINRELPEGLDITGGSLFSRKPAATPPESLAYRVHLENAAIDPERIRQFLSAPSFLYRHKNKKGEEKTVDIKARVLEIAQPENGVIALRLDNRPGSGIRPAMVLREILGLSEAQIAGAKIIKLG